MRLNYIDNIDCLEGLKEIPDNSVDLIITDPPYGINYSSARIKDKNRRLGGILNDERPFTEFIGPALRAMKDTGAMYIFTRWDVQQEFIDEVRRCGGRVKNVLIWDKGVHSMGDLKASYGSKYESILFVPGPAFKFPGKRPQDIIPAAKVPAAKLRHPNEKPVALIEKLINDASEPSAVVLDTFMGSGTTALACIRTGRDYIGFELDEKYHTIALNRVDDEIDALLEV
jgi:site-specific DNA-methyltransferase (adenine-specific)